MRCELSVDQAAQKAIVKREHENGYEIVEVPLPLLVTATAELNEPRQPGLWSSIYAKRYTITHITLRDMPHIDESRIGLNGSPTCAQGIPTTASGGRNAFIRGRRG